MQKRQKLSNKLKILFKTYSKIFKFNNKDHAQLKIYVRRIVTKKFKLRLYVQIIKYKKIFLKWKLVAKPDLYQGNKKYSRKEK